MEPRQKIAELLLRIGAVTLSPEKPFTWASGIRSPIYCDNRILMAFPEERQQVTAEFLHAIRTKNITYDVIAGVATGGIPHAAWIAAALRKPMLYIRGKAKEHGKQNLIEGKLTRGQRVLVVEDLISTGGSSISAIEAVRDAGGVVDHCMAIFTYGFPEATERFTKAHCALITLTDFQTLVAVAAGQGKVSPAQVSLLKRFSENPKGWQK